MSAITTTVGLEETSKRPEWIFGACVAAAVLLGVTPIAIIDELKTSADARELVDSHAPGLLPALREYFSIPEDQSREAVASDRPRGDEPVTVHALWASGATTEIVLRADTPLSEAFAAASLSEQGVNDVVVDFVAKSQCDLPFNFTPGPSMQYAAGDLARSLKSKSDLPLNWLFPWTALPLLYQPSALGVLESRESLLTRREALQNAIDETARVLQCVSPQRPLLRAALLEKHQRLVAQLEHSLTEQASTSALDSAIEHSAPPGWFTELWRPSRDSAAKEVCSNVVHSLKMSDSESARVNDRLRRLRMLLAVRTDRS